MASKVSEYIYTGSGKQRPTCALPLLASYELVGAPEGSVVQWTWMEQPSHELPVTSPEWQSFHDSFQDLIGTSGVAADVKHLRVVIGECPNGCFAKLTVTSIGGTPKPRRPWPEQLTVETVAGWISANVSPEFPRDAYGILNAYGLQERGRALATAAETMSRTATQLLSAPTVS